jgi:hypothetical protein
LAKLDGALTAIADAAKRARLNPAIETILAEHLLLDLGNLKKTATGRN